jgi:hypothetical protein
MERRGESRRIVAFPHSPFSPITSGEPEPTTEPSLKRPDSLGCHWSRLGFDVHHGQLARVCSAHGWTSQQCHLAVLWRTCATRRFQVARAKRANGKKMARGTRPTPLPGSTQSVSYAACSRARLGFVLCHGRLVCLCVLPTLLDEPAAPPVMSSH